MKILKISVAVLVALHSCTVLAMRDGDFGGDYSLSRNEPVGPRHTDIDSLQRAERLRLERELALEKDPTLDFYDKEALEAKALKNHPVVKQDEIYLDQDGDPVDFDVLQAERTAARRDELTEAQLKKIEEAVRSMRVVVKLRMVNPRKADKGFSGEIKKIKDEIQSSMGSDVIAFKDLINKNPEDRVQVNLLVKQAKSLGDALDADLASGKKDMFGRRTPKDMHDIREKLEDLRFVQRELTNIVVRLRNKEELRVEIDEFGRTDKSAAKIEDFIDSHTKDLTKDQRKQLDSMLDRARYRERISEDLAEATRKMISDRAGAN